MFVVQTRIFEQVDRIHKIWEARKEAWEKAGRNGNQPKLYETAEDIINAGLSKLESKKSK